MSGWQSRHKETLQSDWIAPPIVAGVVALAATSTEVDVDLTTMPGSPMNTNINQGADGFNPNCIGHYLTLQADGGDIYVALGPSLGGSTGLGHLTTTQNATVGSNKITVSNNDTIKIPNGTTLQVKLPGDWAARSDGPSTGVSSPCRYLGFLCATGVSATLRMWQSSP